MLSRLPSRSLYSSAASLVPKCILHLGIPCSLLELFKEHFSSPDVLPPSQANEVGLFTLLPRALRLDPVNLLKQLLQPQLKCLVLRSLIEFAQKMSARNERVARKQEGGCAEILHITSSSASVQPCEVWSSGSVPLTQHDPETSYRMCSSSCETAC